MSITLPPYPAEYIDIIYFEEHEKAEEYVKLQNEQILPFAATGICHVPVKSIKYLTSGIDVKTIIDVCVDITELNYCYQPGDTIGILPQNDPREVEEIITRLKYTEFSDKLYSLAIKKDCTKKNAKIPIHIPVIGTIRDVLTNNLDIRCIPKKLFLRSLSKYTSDEEDIQTLNDLCSKEGASRYTKFVTSNYVPLLELLRIFKSAFPPFTILLEHLGRLQPRPYSVASSPNITKLPSSELSFIYSLEILPQSYLGVCTGYLNRILNSSNYTIKHKIHSKITHLGNTVQHDKLLNPTMKIPIYFRKSNEFKLPVDTLKNIIMVCTGTGISPFMSFLRHREKQMTNLELPFGEMMLYYGCRYSDRDFLFKNELESFIKSNVIAKFYPSFSRENNNIKYVQDNILSNKNEFIEMLDNGAILFVCGSLNMSKSIYDIIISCLCQVRNYTVDQASNWVQALKYHKTYIEDIWS